MGFLGCSRKMTKAEFRKLARRHFEAGQYHEAEQEYLSILTSNTDDLDAILHLGAIYYDQGRLNLAGQFLTRVIENETNNLEAQSRLGSIYLSVGALKQARAAAQIVLEGRPEDADAPLLLVEAANDQKARLEVHDYLQKISPGTNPKASSETALAALALKQEPSNYSEARVRLKIAWELNPKLPAYYSVLGTLCRLTNGQDQAEAAFKMASELSPPRSLRRLGHARFRMLRGDTEGARKLLRELTTETPDFITPWLELTRLALAEANLDEASSLLTQAIIRDPDNAEGHKLDALIKLTKGDHAEAVLGLEKLARSYPNSVNIHSNLARAYNLVGNLEGVTREMGEILRLQPGDPQAMVVLARMEMMRGNLESGMVVLEQVIKDHPTLEPALKLLAQGYDAEGDYESELAIYRRLQSSFPEEPGYFVQEGMLLREQGKFNEARLVFENALKLAPAFPKSLPAVEQLVKLDIAGGELQQAMQRVTRLIQANTNSPEPRMLEAGVYLAQRTAAATNQAQASLVDATRIKSDYWPAFLALARIYHANRENEKALADLLSVVKEDPKDKVAWMLIGMIRTDQKEYAEARDSYLRILKANPWFSPALNNLANLYSEHLNQLDQAYTMAKRARELLPFEAATGDTLGWVLYRRGQFGWAITLLEESAYKAGKDPEILYHLAMAQYMMGAERSATANFKRVLEMAKSQEFDDLNDRLTILALDASSNDARPFEERLKDHPDDIVALSRLATIHERKAEYEKAANIWQVIRKVNPDYVTAMINLAQLQADHLNQPQKAYELAQAAYRAAPDDIRTLTLYGRLAFRFKAYKEALGLYRDAVRQQPNNPSLLFLMGESAYYLGEFQEAVNSVRIALTHSNFNRLEEAKLFIQLIETDPTKLPAGLAEQALKDRPDYAPALMVLAGQKEQKGELAAATGIYQKVLSLSPNFMPAVRRLAIIYSAQPANRKLAGKMAVLASETYLNDPELMKVNGSLAYYDAEWDLAIRYFQEALSYKGMEDAKSRYLEALACLQLDRRGDAREALGRALALGLPEPEATDAKRKLEELNK